MRSRTAVSSFAVTRRRVSPASWRCGRRSAEWRASIADEIGGQGVGRSSSPRCGDELLPTATLGLPAAARVVVVVVVPAGEDHAEHHRLHDRGEYPQDQTDLDTDVVAQVRADGALAEEDADGEQKARGGEAGRDRAGHTAAAARLGGAEQRDEAGRERQADDRGRRHLEREARVLALLVAAADAEPAQEAEEEHQNAECA